jgi:hypothetical protein
VAGAKRRIQGKILLIERGKTWTWRSRTPVDDGTNDGGGLLRRDPEVDEEPEEVVR